MYPETTTRNEIADIVKLLVGAMATVILAPLISFAVASPAAATPTCYDVHLVWMIGSGQDPYGDGKNDDPFNDEAIRFIYQVGGAIGDGGYTWSYSQPDWTPYAVKIDSKYPDKYYDSMSRGGRLLAERLERRAQYCPNEYLVLGGYSQGAHSIRSALRNKVPKDIRDRIVAVGLFGDPTQGIVQHSRDGRFETTYKTFLGKKFTIDGLPKDLKGKLHNYCHGDDVVCNVTHRSNKADHGKYAEPGGEIDHFANRFRGN